MLRIDASFGEGGGQIVRSSLALALVTGCDVALSKIRARRKKPGLMHQHLTAVNAAAAISGAKVRGASIGSTELEFEPGPPRAGNYTFRVATAGSATLVLQTILPALLLAPGPSTLRLEGGTHNPLAPPFDFLDKAYLPLVNRLNPTVSASLDRHGFYPAGGGSFSVQVQPAEKLQGYDLLDRGRVIGQRVRALVANLPTHIARRECDTIAEKSGWDRSCFAIEAVTKAHGPGNVVFIEIECEHVTEMFTAFGERGVRAEQVAARVWREANDYLTAGVPVGPHLADQWILPLGIAAHQGCGGAFRTATLTQHATTHLEVLRRFLDVEVELSQPSPGECLVRIG